jgi:tRNA G37 N-methylase Trm5
VLSFKVLKRDTSKVKKELSEEHLLGIRGINPVNNKLSEEYNLIYTKYSVTEREKLEEILTNKNLDTIIIKSSNSSEQEELKKLDITLEKIILSYENFSYTEVVKKLLSRGTDSYSEREIPSSYEIIGKIAHLNLREKFLPYKKIIGQIILDVSPIIYVIS